MELRELRDKAILQSDKLVEEDGMPVSPDNRATNLGKASAYSYCILILQCLLPKSR